MHIVYTIVVILLLFGVTIFVHELGHFLVARSCGMVVEVFSLGFGPALWKRKIRGITYKIGVFPFGGYVALPQMDPGGDERPPESGAAPAEAAPPPPAAPWKRILVSAAGGAGNLLLAVLLAYVVFWVGRPSEPRDRNCVIGFVDPESAAYAAGLRVGDGIQRINDEPVRNWEDFLTLGSLGTQAVIQAVGPEGSKTVSLPTEVRAGLRFVTGLSWMNICEVAGVTPGSSADKAGLRFGDVILEFNGQKLYSREHLIQLTTEQRDQEVTLQVRREGQLVNVQVRPAYDAQQQRALIGIMFNLLDVDYDQVAHPRPGAQLREHFSKIARVLRALVTPKEARAAASGIGGPFMILLMYWLVVRSSLMLAVWFTGFLNVSLAVLNLLPLPVLDGGHIVLALWEAVTRKPVNPRVVRGLWQVFTVLLIGLMLLLTVKDFRFIYRIFGPRSAPPAASATNPPPAAPK